uniref:Thymidine kinase n=1 Tax=Theropithecus gelada TaxID=9565 RepID=A0A8D2EK82_THEGE
CLTPCPSSRQQAFGRCSVKQHSWCGSPMLSPGDLDLERKVAAGGRGCTVVDMAVIAGRAHRGTQSPGLWSLVGELLQAKGPELSDVAASSLGIQGAAAGVEAHTFSTCPFQFPDIVEFCEAMANAGKTVIVAALDGTFQRKPFGTILNLVPLAESVVKLTAVCMECFREAAYTKRLGTEKEVEVIGGADKYHSVCRLCYFKKASGQPAGPDNKENCPVPGKPGEAVAARKLFAPQQILQCSPAN